MFRDLARGVTEVASNRIVLDARSVALLAEQGVGGVEEGQTVKIAVAVDRQGMPKQAAMSVSEGEPRLITLGQARALALAEPMFGNEHFDKLGWNGSVTESVLIEGSLDMTLSSEAGASAHPIEGEVS